MALSAANKEEDDWITPSADGADDWITPKAPETPSGAASFAHAAERGVAPAVGGWAGMVAGAKLGAIAGLFVPGLGETGISEAGGAVIGGLAGALGGGWLAGKTQEEVLNRIPEDVKEKIGQSKSQREAEELAHPYLSMAGELAPNVALLRPGAIAKTAREGAGVLERTLTHPVGARAVGAGFNAAQEAGTELATDGEVDPGKVAIAAGAGALMTHETALGRGIRTKIEGAFPGARIHPGPTPEEVAAPVMAADSVDEAITAAKSQIDNVSVDPEAMAAEAKRQAAEVLPDEPVPPVSPGAAEEIGPEASISGDKPAEPAPEEITPVTQPSAREFPPFADAKVKADTYTRWIGELDAQRRDVAAKSPQARFLQQTEAAILNKVNGVEERLTQRSAERLQEARTALDELLNPVGDSPDMARVRASMVAEHQNMADAVVAHRDEALKRAQEAREHAKALQEPLTDEEADHIAASMTAHQIDAGTAVADHIERKALQEVQSDHGTTGDQAYADAIPVRGGEGAADRGAGNGSEGQAPAGNGEAGENAPGIPAPEIASQALQLSRAPAAAAAPVAAPVSRAARPTPSAKPILEARGPLDEASIQPTPVARAETPIAEAAPEQPIRAKALKAIEGEGAQRERAIGGELYRVGEERPQLEAAAHLTETDFDHAVAVALRQKQPPAGVHPEFVYMAVEAKATADGDVELMRRLSRSKIAEEATTMGQRIAAWRNRDEIAPVDDMRRIQEARAAKSKERGIDPDAAVETMITHAQAEIKRTAKSSKRPSWNDFVISLSCAD